ncbi:NAD(P)H-binding protein [Paucilactobacillus suebicus]|uniref:NAD-dependent epimerase dehydratase n=1 Tax=Paucilactobacillus suebicus DSM 5007 = KCTC 3549 TaxID=1423807 RepID=A0A0R1W0R4_9LACO|nr:NAD(P)H-binding protein [Paucilactobacillus suebicus]KRM11189.1 NAD-dependent epimerase dehydratase [Paucilactobacillus suebicus DSM 5007 = KCTC 3549]
MTNVLVIGATGTVGNTTRRYFLDHTDDHLTLMARNTGRLGKLDETREKAIAGSVTDQKDLAKALVGQDAVFAALSGNLKSMASSLVAAMNESKVKRLIFITSMGIYNEIPSSVGANGNLRSNPVLQNYRDAADVIEASNLAYTIIRPGWFDSSTDTNYEITHKGEPFGGHDVSVTSIADLVTRLVHDQSLGLRDSLGINRK